MPYWLDGAIPLAWLLNDARLKARIQAYLEYIIGHQHEDGWLGPRIEENATAADLWSQALAMKMLVVYHDAAGDERVPGVLKKALLDRHIDRDPLWRWGQFRWFETLIAIWWLYERTNDPWLLDLGEKLHAQGFDWIGFFSRWPLTEPTCRGRWNFAGHVVNNAMAVKSGALWGGTGRCTPRPPGTTRWRSTRRRGRMTSRFRSTRWEIRSSHPTARRFPQRSGGDLWGNGAWKTVPPRKCLQPRTRPRAPKRTSYSCRTGARIFALRSFLS